ncbi:hypothetical protein CHK_0883 [Christensenella hongkongensis]|uniref:Uncharacterized protein n=2 Tax=Christensenella hongkongensis TaxID=270498 RepID=A0A0M2NL75_9FIRM|nr:hypothetical protein CHK_0883 [Christensenella hongkongensis]
MRGAAVFIDNKMNGKEFVKMNCYYIIGLRLNHRTSNAIKLQQALTEYGCNIKMRVGLHETSEEFCADDGVIMLQACGDKETVEKMVAAFNDVEGVTAKMLDLN